MALPKTKLEQIVEQARSAGQMQQEQLASLTMPKRATSTKQDTIKSLQQQEKNLSARLKAVGEKPEKIKDTRNILEKALNLRPDQNFLFDIFEVLKRPQQALFVGAEQAASGGDFFEGFIQGLSGNERTQFKDVLQSVLGSELGDVEGQLDIIDIIGFAGDVFLDPANLPLFMVSGGTTLAGSVANAGAAATATTAATAQTKASLIQNFILGKGKTFAQLSPDDYIKAILSKNARKGMGLEAASISRMTMRSLGSSFKGLTQFGDTVFTEGFKRLDSTENLSKAYEGLKKAVEYATSETGRSVKRILGVARERYETTMLRLKGLDDNLINEFKRITAAKYGIEPTNAQINEFFGVLNVDAMDLYEHKFVDNLLPPDRFIDFVSTNKPKLLDNFYIPYSKNTIDDLVAMFGEENILPYIKREVYQGIDSIAFDSNVFSLENNPEFIAKLKSMAAKPQPLFDKTVRASYEKTLRLKDPEMYNEYVARVKQYEKDIASRVDGLYFKKFGVEYKESKATLAKWNEIKESLMASDFKVGLHPQNTLVNSNVIKQRFDLWLSPSERKAAKALLSPEQLKKYNADITYKKAALSKSLSKEAYEEQLELILMDGDKTLKAYSGITEDLDFTKGLLDAKNKGLIRMGKWENDEIRERIARLSQDKYVVEAADILNDTYRQAQRAVSWGEFKEETILNRVGFEGYAKRTINPELKSLLEAIQIENPDLAKSIEYAAFTPGLTKPLKSQEMYGSVYGINEFQKAFYRKMFTNDDWVIKNFGEADPETIDKIKNYLNTDLFSREATASFYSFMDDTYAAINRNHKSADVLLSLGLGKVGTKGSAFQNLKSSEAVPIGFEKMITRDVTNTIRGLEANMKFQGSTAEMQTLIKGLKDSLKEGRMPVMEKHIYRVLERMNAASPEKALKILDLINNGFKVGKTTSIGFNFKNLTGNMLNQYLAGVPITKSFQYWSKSIKMAKQMELIDDIVISKGFRALTEDQKNIYRIYEEFLDAGFFSHASVYRLNDLDITSRWSDAKTASSKIMAFQDNPVTRANMGANLWVDNRARLSLYLYAKDNPEFLAQLGIDPTGADAAMNAVRLVHFDPSDLTFFEDDVMKRLIPFYTFARQNLAFQMKNIMRNSEKYVRINSAFESFNQQFAGMAPEDLQSYQREQFYVPIFRMENGEFAVVKSSLTISALTEIPLDPAGFFGEFLSRLSPAIRAPFELATGQQLFTGQPIERYRGEPSTRIPLPFMTKSAEWLISQTGLDVPLGVASQLGSAAVQAARGEDPTQAIFRSSGILTTMSPESNQLTKLYEDLDNLKARVQVLKTRGIELPTLQEVSEKSQFSRTNQQIEEMNKILGLLNRIKR